MSEDTTAAYEGLIQFLYQAPIGLVQTTLDGEITMINPMSASLLMPLAKGGHLVNLFDVLEHVAPELPLLVEGTPVSGGPICEGLRFEVGPRSTSGEPPTTLSLTLLRLDESTLMASVADVTLEVRHEQLRVTSQLRDAGRIDSLTSMPTRTVVIERIQQALRLAAADPDYHFAVLFINADRFDRINLTLGQSAGDELLRLMAGRLNGTLRQRDSVGRATDGGPVTARLGGDEFVIVLEELREVEAASAVAQRLIEALCKPYLVGDTPVHLTASMGVVLRDQAGIDADAVLQDAGLAMREAKRAGGARFKVFEPLIKERAQRRGSVESDLRRALVEHQLFVVYQPIVDLHAGGAFQVSGAEALVRWRHPVRGVVPPIEFIEIAEETGLIGELGNFVLNEACRQLVAWRRQLGSQAPSKMSVNLSCAQLLDPTIVAQVEHALASSGLAAGHLQLEVTESLAAQDQQIQARLRELKVLGLSLALDDFGTGYSSLACLHQLPIDVVKIDRSFVSQVESSAHHRVLIEATVRVARSLGMSTVAEGIETDGQAGALAALDCDKGQGYLWARPMPAAEATRWLVDHAAGERPSRPLRGVLPVQRLLDTLERTHTGVALFDPSEQLVYSNLRYRELYAIESGEMPTWDDIVRHAGATGRGPRLSTDDIDRWLADAHRSHPVPNRRIRESEFSDGRWMRVVEETSADGWRLCLCTDVTSFKVREGELRQARDAAVAASLDSALGSLGDRSHWTPLRG